MVGGSKGESLDWDALLDLLSACITPQEAAAVRQAAADRGSPMYVIDLHNHVARLMVQHGIATWNQLHASFPGYSACGNEAGSGARGGCDGLRGQGQPKERREVREGNCRDDKSGTSSSADDPPRSPGRSSRGPHSTVRHAASADEAAVGQKRRSDRPPATKEHSKQRKTGATNTPGGTAAEKITLADYPHVLQWWHPTKNGDKQPADYTHGSGERAWLQCPGCPSCGKVHEWQGKACKVSKPDFGCPVCACKRQFCSCRAISANERLATEWHEDNPPATTVARGSNRKYKWRCSDAACGHVWEARPDCRSRPGHGSNCPKCFNKKCSTGWKYPSVAVGRPKLLTEWDEERNTILPTEVSLGSNKQVWWLCRECGKSWQAAIVHRAIHGRGCPKRH